MTVDELRAKLANLPGDAVVECETGGDYLTWIQVAWDGDDGEERHDLDDIRPGDTAADVVARAIERSELYGHEPH
jgi:hypothetical protein